MLPPARVHRRHCWHAHAPKALGRPVVDTANEGLTAAPSRAFSDRQIHLTHKSSSGTSACSEVSRIRVSLGLRLRVGPKEAPTSMVAGEG